jgi:ABC-type multidrug transport system fused ATPase/permease subunit
MVSIIIAFLTIIVAKYWIILSAKSGREVTNSNKVINEFLLRKIGSPRLVRLSNTLNLEEYRFDKLAHKQMNNNIHAFALQLKTEVLVEPLIISFGLLIVYLSLTVLILKIESIALFLIILVRLVPVLKEILMQWQSIQRYLGSIEIVEDRLLSMEKNSEKDTGIKNFYKLKNRVEFLNVTYFYPNSSTPALFDVSLKIPVNKLIAIVGPSGGGKSTLVDLMPKLRRPSSGKILFDDINIELFKNTGIRSAIAYVPQKSQIFNGTISDHIKYGYPNATEIEMKRAAKLAGADDFIRNLSKAYDTNIGEDGGHLSGGQKQRLDIARALIRKASILILDEPTSNLDVDSERGLIDSLSRIIHDTNTTIIVISHNLKTVVKSDIIFVLNNGKIEQTGTHLELLSKELWYSKAWRKATY